MVLDTVAAGDNAAGRNAELGRFEFQFQSNIFNMYTAMAATLGSTSRAELVELLRNAGYGGQSVQIDPDGPLPEGVELLLADMNFVAQFAAVRNTHAAIAEHGESPARLGGLVRGYANLAMLTRHHWTSANTAFAARALLYAERLMSLDGSSRLAQQHRVYARALVGLHGIAIQDLDRLPATESDSTSAEHSPSWTKVIEPFCRFNCEQLIGLAIEPGLNQLVPQLAFELKAGYDDPRWTSDVGMASVRVCPLAFGIYAEMADRAPMLIERTAVGMSMEALGQRLPRTVAAIEDLPRPAADLVRELSRPRRSLISELADGQDRSAALSPLPMQLAEALRLPESTSNDAGEPSWNALAQLIADEQFIELANCLEVSLIATESSKQGLVDRMAPLVESHPYAPYILSFAIDGSRQPAELAQLLGRIRVTDPRGRMQPLFEKYRGASDASGKTYDALSNEALWQHDYTLPAINDSLRMVYENWWKLPQLTNEFHHLIDSLNAISPCSPAILILEIDTTTEPSPELLAEWESRAQSDPKALGKIAKLYADRRLFEPAIRCYSDSYDLSPNQKTTTSLAETYRDSGQVEKWLPTMERYLQVEDNELGHSTIHRKIALDYLERCEWAQAEPHALVTANTWSTMGLVTASRVYEGMRRWDESERWIREATVNYRTHNGMQWYLWCRRTGRGDRQQAKLYADDFMRYSWFGRPENGIYYPFLNLMIEKRYDDALTLISQTPACADDPSWQLQAAILAKRAGQEQQYQSSMKKAMDLADQQLRIPQPQLFAFAEILFAGRDATAYTDAQLEDAEKLLTGFSFADRSNCAYFLGEMLALQGDQKHAEKYWRITLDSGQFDNRHATLAGWRLAEKHGTSTPDKVEPPAESPAETAGDEADSSL